MFYCEFCEISKNVYFEKYLPTVGSWSWSRAENNIPMVIHTNFVNCKIGQLKVLSSKLRKESSSMVIYNLAMVIMLCQDLHHQWILNRGDL